jgi:hypothetical protein
VEDCGSPFLTYHHFDPPYREGRVDVQRGITPLCHTHHDQAAGGRWTKEQLHRLKQFPYLAGKYPVAKLGWLRGAIVFRAGSNEFVIPSVLLTMAGRQIIWANRSANGDMLLNIELFDKNGAPLFIMHDNDWKLAGKVRASR